MSSYTVQPSLFTCHPSGEFLFFPGQCEVEISLVRNIQNFFPIQLSEISEFLHPKVAILTAVAASRFLTEEENSKKRSFLELRIITTWVLCDAVHYLLK